MTCATRQFAFPLVALAALCCPAGAARQRAGATREFASLNPVLATPDLTAYDPTEVLCAHGKDASGRPVIQGWCRSWLACIRAAATPQGDKAAVMAAWKPADCREVCGVWPVLSPPENSTGAPGNHTATPGNSTATPGNGTAVSKNNTARMLLLQGGRDCESSCHNFQASLSSCVATVLFEPGKVAAMGIPSNSTKKLPVHCAARNTTCLPDLPLRYQKCIAKAQRPGKECKALKMDVQDCHGCPQLDDGYVSKYHAFIGGCMDQLNAYWQATHPQAGTAALPGASGCKVH